MTIDTSAKKKSLEFEINLVPFIDMLSACLSFLLLTAVWTYVGTIDTKQAIGAASTSGAQNPPSIVVQVDPDNSFEFQLKDVKTKSRNFLVRAEAGQPDWIKVDRVLTAIRKQYPEINTSVVLTRPKVKYGLIIKTVDSLKKASFKEVGISPM
jgi:biopolymer transport protein TolR